MQTPSTPDPPDDDARWASAFLRDTLGRWRTAVDRPSGLFVPHLDREWRRMDGGPLTLVSQCRLIYNFCRGVEAFGDTPAADAAARGLHALQTHFRIAPGLYRWAVDADGAEADPTPDAYGHAFCLLALSTAARVFDDASLAARALETWEAVSTTLVDRHGGLLWRLSGPEAWTHSPRSQNPLMHMFEALLALRAVDDTGIALAAAEKTLRFLQARSDFSTGMLVERHTPEWQPLPVEAGGVVDLGHAFEWAWLLSEWSGITRDRVVLELGERFLHSAIVRGLDTDGGVFQSCDPQGRMVSRTKGLWQQCEAIRALRRYVTVHGRADLRPLLSRCLSFYQDHFADAEHGGVFAAIDAAGHPTDLHKGDAWKLDYHTVGMCLELMNFSV